MGFGSSRGDIHFHKLAYQKKASDVCHNVDALVSIIIDDLADNVVAAVDELDNFISDHYEELNAFPSFPRLHLGKYSMYIREQFCTSINGGDERFN